MNFYFDCGLPRSGSTLLTALLNQNPQIHAGTLSPVFEVMYYTNDRLQGEQAQAFPKPEVFRRMVSNVITEYYSDRDEEVIIDKCRAWPAHIDLIKQYITPDPKIICTVRHPLDILASFITLFHKDGGLNFIDKAMLKQGHRSRPTDSHNLISSQAGSRRRPLRPDGNHSPLPFSTKDLRYSCQSTSQASFPCPYAWFP